MQFYFLTESGTSDHYHQNPELFYILKGTLEVKIDDKVYELRQEDIVLINANKRHTMTGKEGILAARFEIDFHLLAEYMGTMQLLFWCNTIVDKMPHMMNCERYWIRFLPDILNGMKKVHLI